MSAPHSIGRHKNGVAKVLSIIKGTLFVCAMFASFSISHTASAGFAIVSQKTALVFGLKAFCMVCPSLSAFIQIHSIPSFFNVTPNKLTVPPYTAAVEIKLSPALHTFKIERSVAACPLEVSSAPMPFSKAASFFSTASHVGFEMREYINSVGISNN